LSAAASKCRTQSQIELRVILLDGDVGGFSDVSIF
jgi:hypothetical protein